MRRKGEGGRKREEKEAEEAEEEKEERRPSPGCTGGAEATRGELRSGAGEPW